jgi:hypothetical protein
MSFSYTSVPLSVNSIRLLTLYPSETADTSPSCSLETVDLDGAPDFTALSYAWGNASQRTLIKVNSKELSITSALDTALRHLRLTGRGRRLWIDQICIKQADDDEKASQVQLMRRIYSQAETTIAWLGEERDGSNKVMGKKHSASVCGMYPETTMLVSDGTSTRLSVT